MTKCRADFVSFFYIFLHEGYEHLLVEELIKLQKSYHPVLVYTDDTALLKARTVNYERARDVGLLIIVASKFAV